MLFGLNRECSKRKEYRRSEMPRVLVCQHGARRGYAVPRMLEQAGCLIALFTDSSRYSLLGRIASVLGGNVPGKIRRLANREVIGVPPGKIYSSDVLVYKETIGKIFRNEISQYQKWCFGVSGRMEKWVNKIDEFDIVYNMFCENLNFIRFLKNNFKVKIVTDVYVHPNTKNIVAKEAVRLGIETYKQQGIQDVDIEYIQEAFELSDILLCPSQFVADGVFELNPSFGDKIRLCPYGTALQFEGLKTNPCQGRVFWAGGDWVRKGLHLFACAADILTEKYPDMEFRVAGIEDPFVNGLPRFKSLKFLGKLDKDQMLKEFLTADCFVIPSLAEGMAGVAIEASAVGCPVIATKGAGMDGIIDQVNGFLIRSGDVSSLVGVVEALYKDRELRSRVSRGAKDLSKNFSEDSWRERLMDLILSLR